MTMRTMTLALTALFLLAAPLAALAHEGSRASATAGHGAALGEPGDPKANARIVAVSASDKMRFSPERIAVKRGETVRFVMTNVGATKHEMVLGTRKELRDHAKLMQRFPEMEHDDPNAVAARPGETAELVWKFTKAGEFYFGCLVPGHFESGMHGKIVVTR